MRTRAANRVNINNDTLDGLLDEMLRATMKLQISRTEILNLSQANLYKSEYIGSGTFIITKPKRKAAKMRQTRLKNVKRGSRK